MFVRKTGGPSLTPIGAQLMTDIDVETCLESYSQTHNRILNNNNVSTVIRTAVWPKQRVLAHGKNVFWTLQYWKLLQKSDATHAKDYGYVKDKRQRTIFQYS